MAECTVLPGVFGVLVQGLLFLCVCGVLLYKKHREDREGQTRTWNEFVLDSSKQIIGAGWIHVLNMMCAKLLGGVKSGDECNWYWVNIMIDTTVGVLVQYLILRGVTWLIETNCGDAASLYRSGEYRGPNGEFVTECYIRQLIIWLLVVSSMKLIMVLMIITFDTPLQVISGAVLKPFLNSPASKLIVVMVLTPMCMNAFQFWVTDNFIKKKGSARGSQLQRGEPSDAQPNGVCSAP